MVVWDTSPAAARGLQAGVWGLGALRLSQEQAVAWTDALSNPHYHGRPGFIYWNFYPFPWQRLILFPLAYPLQAAFGSAQSLSTWLLHEEHSSGSGRIGDISTPGNLEENPSGPGGSGNTVDIGVEPGSQRSELLIGRIYFARQPPEGF